MVRVRVRVGVRVRVRVAVRIKVRIKVRVRVKVRLRLRPYLPSRDRPTCITCTTIPPCPPPWDTPPPSPMLTRWSMLYGYTYH